MSRRPALLAAFPRFARETVDAKQSALVALFGASDASGRAPPPAAPLLLDLVSAAAAMFGRDERAAVETLRRMNERRDALARAQSWLVSA